MNPESSHRGIACRGITPQIHDSCWLAPNASVIGQVTMAEESSCWFNAVIRGDVSPITIGKRVNIQDGAVIHGTLDKSQTTIEDDASIGHNAIVHGALVGSGALIGMGAIVMDDCIVESNSIIAAGAVVTQGTHVESGCIYAGTPAKKIKEVDQALFEGEIMRIADNYLKYSSWYKD